MGLRIEDRPTDGIIRVFNPSSNDATLYYGWANGFGDLQQMLWIRYRDGAGNIVRIGGDLEGGWWTPLAYSSTSYGPGEWPPMRKLTIPRRGFLDLRRDIGAISGWIHDELVVTGPCEIQIMFRVNPRRRTRQTIELVTEWQPADCPVGS